MGTKYNRKPNKKYYQINHNIRAPKLRVLDDKGKQRGIYNTGEALEIARAENVDLVLVAERANPPVARLIDFKKFLYQIEKKEKKAKKGIKKSTTKDINLSLFIGEQDFERFIDKARDFLTEGHQVRVKIFLKGREIAKKPMAFDLINKFIERTGIASASSEPRMQGRSVITVLTKKKDTAQINNEKQTENT